MRIPNLGEVLIGRDGQKWAVSEVTTADEIANELDDGETVDADYFLVTVVVGDDPDDLDADSFEFINTEFAQFCEDEGIKI
ncbi:hypothetical protein P606_19525 [Comamonas thiooxydans]|nr:hypothetical protein P606_19525 [Comamonas thiooxydans]